MSITYDVIQQPGAVPIKLWTRGVPLEDAAREQLQNIARLPFIHRWISVMPDVHLGKGERGIIPGSMGAKSFIVRGLGNEDSFHSCSHGAGRVMSRTQARKLISVDEHAKATAHVECRKDVEVVDESPAAYKSIEAVMEAQRDLVEIVHTLRQVVCVKG
jgi:RNA-splicing ligase RtcB